MSTRHRKPSVLPGEEFIWVLVFGEIIVFMAFFCIFLMYRSHDLDLYRASRLQLNAYYGFANMFLMLISSWFVATGLAAIRRADQRVAQYATGLALVCGLLFCGLKYMEYQGQFAQGIYPQTNEFFQFYFLLTGIHLVHVLVAVSVLSGFYLMMCWKGTGAFRVSNFESGAIYWHMADFIWIVLFPLIYLLP